MFGIGGFELFIILVFGFLIFGPDKLPDIARTIGKGIARFREAQADMNETIGNEKIFDPNNPDEPFKDPIEALDKIAQRQEERRKAKDAGAKAAAGAAAATAGAQASNAQATSGDPGPDAPRAESFTERKARYERERAARKAAEAEAAAKAAEEGASQEPQAPEAGAGPDHAGDSPETAPVQDQAPGATADPAGAPAKGGDA